MTAFRKGDNVKWQAPGGSAEGKVKKKLTSDTHIKKHTVRASKDDPQYLVETEDGKAAAHKPDALKKV